MVSTGPSWFLRSIRWTSRWWVHGWAGRPPWISKKTAKTSLSSFIPHDLLSPAGLASHSPNLVTLETPSTIWTRAWADPEVTHPCTAKPPPIDGDEGGVAVSFSPPGEPWEGGDVEGTAKLTATPSSESPGKQRRTHGELLSHSELLKAIRASVSMETHTCCWLARLNQAHFHHLWDNHNK